jgi:hypothetical protein
VAAKGPEAALIPDPRQEPGQRVITGVPEGTALVDPVHDQIGSCQLVKTNHMRVTHPKASRKAAERVIPDGASPAGKLPDPAAGQGTIGD